MNIQTFKLYGVKANMNSRRWVFMDLLLAFFLFAYIVLFIQEAFFEPVIYSLGGTLPMVVFGLILLTGAIYTCVVSYNVQQSIRAVVESQEKFQAVFETSNDALMLLDSEHFLDVNDATIKLFKYRSRDEFLGKHPADVSPPVQPDGVDSRIAANEHIAKAMKEGKNYFKWTHRRAQGDDFPATVLLTPLMLDGKPVLQATVRDITDEMEVEKRLLAADRMKSRFISLLSHVSRTPLSKVRWSLESMMTGEFGKISSEMRFLIREALGSNDDLIRLIQRMNTVLDIERKSLRVVMAPISLSSLIRSAIDKCAERNHGSGISWSGNFRDFQSDLAKIDGEKMRMAIEALLENVARYGREKEQEGVVNIVKQDGSYMLEIIDNGIGIPASEQPDIFRMFYRGSNAVLHHPDGVGVGLYVAKAIVELHGGTLGFESEEGKGSRFWVKLPVAG